VTHYTVLGSMEGVVFHIYSTNQPVPLCFIFPDMRTKGVSDINPSAHV
jgi:hypothetical protein